MTIDVLKVFSGFPEEGSMLQRFGDRIEQPREVIMSLRHQPTSPVGRWGRMTSGSTFSDKPSSGGANGLNRQFEGFKRPPESGGDGH